VKDPFYPLELPLYWGSDLTTIGGGSRMAKGASADGGYRFRTSKSVAYPSQALHFALTGHGFAPLITQMYIAGAPENKNDQLLKNVRA
jgi:protocatechuate 3,4-dioxygenase beta subunit